MFENQAEGLIIQSENPRPSHGVGTEEWETKRGSDGENWRTGELENWRTGELENWRKDIIKYS
jgi:predicted alpha/beta hydrolase family esterase